MRNEGGGLKTLAHEIAHPLIDADAPHAQPWMKEGLPVLFEVVDFSPSGELHFKAHLRLQTLRDALASKDPVLANAVRLAAPFTKHHEFYRAPSTCTTRWRARPGAGSTRRGSSGRSGPPTASTSSRTPTASTPSPASSASPRRTRTPSGSRGSRASPPRGRRDRACGDAGSRTSSGEEVREDERAVGAIAIAFAPMILEEAPSALGERYRLDDADVMQDFIVKLLEGRLRFPEVRGAAIPWMKRMAKVIAQGHLRKVGVPPDGAAE